MINVQLLHDVLELIEKKDEMINVDLCACGIDNTQPRIWHKWTSNHLCRYHEYCSICTEDNFALLINGAVEYLKGYNEETKRNG